MSATFATKRRCPYCGDLIRLAACPIVATNFDGVEFRDAVELDLDDITLPSGSRPLRLLDKTGWPVVASAPDDRRPAAPAPTTRRRSRLEEAFGPSRSDGTGEGDQTPLTTIAGQGLASEDLPARACPSCEYPLPRSIDERPAVVIAVVGVNRVGKTHFLASSLTLAYRERALAAIGCTEFVPDDSTSQRFMMDYFYPLFRRGELLSVTAAEDDEVRFKPLIFNVVMDGVAFSLIMHDIAGEVLGDHRKRARAATYLRAARGIIFVVDPRDIDSLRTGLPEWILDSNEIAFDQGALLAECLRSDGILAEREPVPVAVTIAKADLIPEACGEVPGFLMRPSPVESESELIDRIKAHGREVVEFLDRHGAHNILGPAHEYDRRVSSNGGSTRARVTYHAVSALGSAPDLNEELVDRVEPLNCVDPLAAILLQIARS